MIKFSSSAGTCDCEKLSFCDEHDNHIITNFKCKSHFSKGQVIESQIISIITNKRLLLIQALMVV